MVSTVQQVINHVFVGILAIILLGGTMLLLVLGRPVPEFIVGFDGVIVTAAFATGAFFVQARQSLPVATALSSSMSQHHELALASIHTTNLLSTGTIGPTASGPITEAAK